MSLSWFFGSKKKTPDSDPPDHATEAQGYEYVFIEKKENTQSDNVNPGICPYPLPYTLAPRSESELIQQAPANNVEVTNVTQNQNFLSGVPFKLSSDTSAASLDSVNRNRIHADEVLSRISQLNSESFDYDFLVEKSVILETEDR